MSEEPTALPSSGVATTPQLALRSAMSALINRIDLDRSGVTFWGKRDIYRALGYRAVLRPTDYWDRYRRGGVAKRVIETFPMSTWRGGAAIQEEPDATTPTKFEAAVKALDKRLHLWQTFQQADILAGLGHYSVILLGGPGKVDSPLTKCPPDGLKFLRSFPERDVIIDTLIDDQQNERFGFPEYYNINLNYSVGR